MTLKGALGELGRGGWLAALASVVAIGMSECHRSVDARKLDQQSQDMLVRRMDLRFDWLKDHTRSLFHWAEQASPILKVPPPMDFPEDAWPMAAPMCESVPAPRVASDLPPVEEDLRR